MVNSVQSFLDYFGAVLGVLINFGGGPKSRVNQYPGKICIGQMMSY